MIYADYNGSAPLLPSVREHLKRRLDSDLFANPNAIHSMGQKISKGIEKCREIVAQVVGAYPDQIVFNSGSSEGLSTLIHSVLEAAPKNKRFIITSAVEHAAVLSALRFYEEKRGFKLAVIGVTSEGKVEIEKVQSLLRQHSQETALVCIMAANNETGVLQPYQEIAKLASSHGADYICDTTQLIGKGEFHFEASGVDYAVCSGHKVGALSGTGFIIAKDPTKLSSLVFGSHQERGLRGGTQNYLGIETLAVALKDFDQQKTKLASLKAAREAFEQDIKQSHPEVVIIGEKTSRLAGTTLISYPGIHGQAVQIELESHDVFVTTSAACADNEPETSQVLRAMGVSEDVGRGVIRISLSTSHGEQEYQQIARALKSAYNKLKKIHSY